MRIVGRARRVTVLAVVAVGLIGLAGCADDPATGGVDDQESALSDADRSDDWVFLQALAGGGFEDLGGGEFLLVAEPAQDELLSLRGGPDGATEEVPLEDFVEDWADAGFADAPPMAAIVLGAEPTDDAETIIVQLRDPVVEDDGTVSFAAELLADEDASRSLAPFAGATSIEPPEEFGRASLVIDASTGARADR